MLAFIVIIYLITLNSVRCSEYSWNLSHHGHKIPQEIMVEVVNDLALKLLAIHNEGNENNIALSPYGALSVLVALAEGVQGNALDEIQRASKIPPDLSIIRIGLRDIHRHLKSYFIPEEGFLSGLSLSHDNVTLNKNYEEVIRFYGFDIDSINNAVYPQAFTSTRPSIEEDENQIDNLSTSTTEPSETETTSEHFLILMTEKTETSTLSNDNDTSTIISTLDTTTGKTTTIVTEDTKTPFIQSTADNRISTTDEETAEKISTLALTQTTTSTTDEETAEKISTFSLTQTTTSTTDEETAEKISTLALTQTTTSTTEEEDPEKITTSALSQTTTSTTTTDKETTKIESETTTANIIGSTVLPDTIKPVSSMLTTENVPIFPTEAKPTLITEQDRADNDIVNLLTTSERSTEETTTATIQSNSTTVSLSRKKRSLVDYFIARYYDDNIMPNKPPPFYVENDKYFLINGNQKEPNANFMVYDTVLPYHYLPHLKTQVLRFPLDSSKYYLLLLLPEGKEDVNKLICNLRLNTNLKYIIDHLQYVHVKASIPSFMLKGLVVLTSTLQKMGVRKVFEPRQADFTPMTDDKRIYVTNIEQAITVNIRNYVDPITMKNSKRYLQQIQPIEFKVDHPFLYFVIDSEINVTLMTGKIVNPLNARIK